MKNLYVLRHGKTTLNKTWRHQHDSTPLSEIGHIQARNVAEEFKNIPLDIIIASTYERARETAQYVSNATGVPIEYSESVIELKRPSELKGVSWFSPKSLYIMSQLYLHIKKPFWHYSDEENLLEFHERTKRVLNMLAERPEKNILLVTHGGFMSSLLSSIRKDGLETIQVYRRSLWKSLHIPNCSYFHATWKPDNKLDNSLKGEWSLVSNVRY